MTFGFLNVLMLAGLSAIALPILAHLLSKRRFDVVQWGAMQFLELGQKTRRRIRIQDLLLLLLRIGVVALVALALARPWGSGALLGALGTPLSRDVVFILDGSASMAWRGDGETPHAQGVQWIHEALEELQPGDTATLIDARTTPRLVVHPPTGNFRLIREALARLPEPAGTSDLVEAVSQAAKILNRTMNVSREVVVLTDHQAVPWQLEDEFAWARLDDQLRQPEIPPSVHVVPLGDDGERVNFSVDRIDLSRDFTVPGFPIRIRTTVRQSGGTTEQKAVMLDVDGQRLIDQTRQVNILPDGEALVEFEHVFASEGRFVVSVSIDGDQLPADDRSDAVISIKSGIPVLLVDGDPSLDETRSETFFVKSVFASSGLSHSGFNIDAESRAEKSPWVRGTVIRSGQLTAPLLWEHQVLFLCNVSDISRENWELVAEFVAAGGGLVVAPGDKVNGPAWNRLIEDSELPVLPATFGQVQREDRRGDPVTVDSLSLERPWLQRFRKETGVDFWQTRFARWWELSVPRRATQKVPGRQPPDGDSDLNSDPDLDNGADESADSETQPAGSVIARLSTGDPLIVASTYGEGTVFQLAVPLDADWSTLPARSDFVPFLHELVFLLSPNPFPRNVDAGSPLLLPLKDDELAENFVVDGPGIESAPPRQEIEGTRVVAMHRETAVPGVYRFSKVRDAAGGNEPFVVTADRQESDLTPMTAVDWEKLADQHGVHVALSMGELTAARQGDRPRMELWWLLLLLVLAMLIAEVALTRKMVQGGHAILDPVTT